MEKILEILKNIRPEFDFEKSNNFIVDGYLDSFDIITLINALEETFDITVDGLDIVPENFVNCEAIRNLVIKNGVKNENVL